MASIIDAIEETLHDEHSLAKFIIYAIPVLGTYALFYVGNMGWFYFLGFLTALMLLTILIKTINNVRNSKNHVLPTFNVFTFAYSSIKAIFAVLPVSGLCIWAGIKLAGIQIPIALPYIQTIYATIVWLLLGSIMITSLIIYSKNEKISDAYNFNLIQRTCVDILFALIGFVPQIILFNALIIGIVVYLFKVFNISYDNPILVIVVAFSLIISIPISGNYFAQIDWEQITREEEHKDQDSAY